ncbi:restriction endonuclease [Methylocapsa polymorpha]|uniref:Restriction endonuclease n=1 Tax=Methylocapsa polymorpha TaxID=3080828 RepID=A0ABZ0HTW1_9HYPH|nr:restriction endonuclease [Methylocapsa sp. RX1]
MYQIEIRHDELNRYRVITGRDSRIVEEKARVQRSVWAQQWAEKEERNKWLFSREKKKDEAVKRTAECHEITSQLENILTSCIESKNEVEWEKLKSYGVFDQVAPVKPIFPDFPLEPEFVLKLSFSERLIPFLRRRAEREAHLQLKAQQMRWEQECESLRQRAAVATASYDSRQRIWQTARDKFEDARLENNDAVDDLCARYNGGDPTAIEEYCDIVLSNSEYPDCFPRDWMTSFDSESAILVVEFRLPSLADMPTVKEVKYIASRDVLEEVRLKENFIRSLYDSVAYQVCLRTLHELFSADKIKVIKSIVFNGWVNYIDIANGQKTQACIITVQALAEQFREINLSAVDPKACFRSLKGIGSTKLHTMVPVQPVLKLNRTDHRFIASIDVVSRLEEGTNLAAIGWEEFEHLIRDIFEREFSNSGGEVKVTQASRDGGVDAIAFDPDPIRGGKIVIQAKRYTNTVGVSAVRDLYGTVVNEGATKGILVTTSNFGPDAYNFAKDKPLTLMDGNNLLFLLSKHGHQAHIDLVAAKKLGVSLLRSVSGQ